ncbi:MAG TPA: BamA/TamA family outer membrane protein [Gemmatimonadales bacterium]
MSNAARMVVAGLALGVLSPGTAAAQYFGRNKVMYAKFDFKIIQTQHFDVHYYDREAEAALDVSRMAERSYAKLARILNHEFNERKPILLYASHSEFQQTNLAGGDIDESTGGFTDYLLHRNTFPLTGSYDDVEHVLQHEMVHQFQFDIWSRGRGISGVQGIYQVNAPLWWGEGMAEYLSIGPVDPNTAMWLRDAALEGKLPTARDFYRIFPYRFGHALVSYIGARWGDEAVGQITKSATGSSIELAIRRVTGLSFEMLVDQWRDAVQKQFLPEVGARVKARTLATPLLNEENSDGTWHLAPALSPDGSLVAYFSEKDFFFVDLYLADGNTGKPIRRILESSYSSNYETYRFLYSSVSWSADGKYLAFAAKREGKDDLVIVDPRRNKEIKRIKVPISGITAPAFSPDGQRLVFSGLGGGISDLYTVGVDGKNLERITNDRYAELHPTWSPDGKTIAFVTDRGPGTDFERLIWGPLRVGLYDVASGKIDLPEGMGVGRNVSPQWAPDGQGLAFVSDRNGVNNIFIYEVSEGLAYQLTDFYTGVSGITPLSPALSWSALSDRLAFVYFEQGKYDVYSLSSPRLLKKEPWREGKVTPAFIVARPEAAPAGPALASRAPAAVPGRGLQQPKPPFVLSGRSLYRTREGFRASDSLGAIADSLRGPEPVSIARILDSTSFDLPDTAEFTRKSYKVKFNPEYVSQPSIGYARDNFGRALYGQATIVLGDMLGDHRLAFATTLNGRLEETALLGQYANLSRRVAWTLGLEQQPYYGYGAAGSIEGETPGEAIFIQQFRRLIYRTLFGAAYFPTSRFRRWELGLQLVNADDDLLQYSQPYDLGTGFPTGEVVRETIPLDNHSYAMPSLALVYDNSLFGYVGPFMGRRSRIEIAQSLGSWQFTQGTFDYRRYDRIAGPIRLASRFFYFGRRGRDAEQFTFFGGTTELIRGHTYGSYQRNECLFGQDPAQGCAVNNLIGSQVAIANIELRFPLLNAALAVLPIPLPGIEGALFYDIGMVWDNNSVIKWDRSPNDPYVDFADVSGSTGRREVRDPVQAWGASIRGNLLGFLILRLDYARPINRPGVKQLWTLSLGPTF